MRKTYISPTIKAHKVQMTSILAVSLIDYSGPNTGDGPTNAEGKAAIISIAEDDFDEE